MSDQPHGAPPPEGPRIDLSSLVAIGGRLDGELGDLDDDGGLDLRYRMELELVAHEMPARLRLVRIGIPVRSWRELPGVVVELGPNDVEIHDGQAVRSAGLGDLRAGDVRQPVAATRIEISDVMPSPPRAIVHLAAVVYPPTGEPATMVATPVDLSATVDLEAIRLFGQWADAAAAVEAAAQLVDLADYRQEVDDGVLCLIPTG